jgi:hypothetical protein
MVADEQVRRIALFFLFSLMDEKMALQAAHTAIAQLKAAHPPGRNGEETEISSREVIRLCRKIAAQYRKLLPRNRPMTLPSSAWNLPKDIDLATWVRFQKDASDEEIIALVLAKILGYSEDEVAKGLEVSPGTVRFRIGKAVRQLGIAGRAGRALA